MIQGGAIWPHTVCTLVDRGVDVEAGVKNGDMALS